MTDYINSLHLYRISRTKYATTLEASGRANRWNKEKQYVIYAASSRALAILELVAHRNAIMEGVEYKTMLITTHLSDPTHQIETVSIASLPKKWNSLQNYFVTQKIGSDWYKKGEKLLLKVPSALVTQEYNYLINTRHPDFSKAFELTLENFSWDRRLL